MDFDELVDFTNIIQIEEIPCCPFCDNAMFIGEDAITYARANDMPFLCHTICLMQARDEHGI